MKKIRRKRLNILVTSQELFDIRFLLCLSREAIRIRRNRRGSLCFTREYLDDVGFPSQILNKYFSDVFYDERNDWWKCKMK